MDSGGKGNKGGAKDMIKKADIIAELWCQKEHLERIFSEAPTTYAAYKLGKAVSNIDIAIKAVDSIEFKEE